MRTSAGKAPIPFNQKPQKPKRDPGMLTGKGGAWVGLDGDTFYRWVHEREAERAKGESTAYRSPEGNAS